MYYLKDQFGDELKLPVSVARLAPYYERDVVMADLEKPPESSSLRVDVDKAEARLLPKTSKRVVKRPRKFED